MAYGKKKKTNNQVDWQENPNFTPYWYNEGFVFYGSGGNGKPTGGNMSTRSGGSAAIQLAIGTPDGNYVCQSVKGYTEKSSIIQDLTDSDSFTTISTFSKNKGALTLQTASAIVLKNVSNIAQEIAISHWDWRNDSGGTTTDVHNSVDINEENSTGEETALRVMSFILPAGDFVYLPTSRIISYSPLSYVTESGTLESGGNAPAGTIAIEPKDINSVNEFRGVRLMSGSTYGTGTEVLTDEPVAIGETAIDVDDGDWFEVNDLIMIDSEVMSIESISTNTLTVKRGLLGSTEVTHTEDDELLYFFGNESLPFDNGKCMTDQNGYFKQSGAFFGYGRTADTIVDGLVAGSVAIGPFYTQGGYLDWGLQNIKASDKTGLAASTAYTFHIAIDEYSTDGVDGLAAAPNGEVAIAFTTDASDTTWAGSGNAVLPKIQAVFDEKFYDASVGLFNKKVTIGLRSGDVRVTSHSNHSESRVGIANVSGTTPFGVGRFPAISSGVPVLLGSPHGGGTTDTMVFGPASTLPQETIDDAVTGKVIQNISAFLLDDGNGNLLHNGSVVGWVSYVTGHCEFTHLPNAEFKVYAESHSAHSGGSKYVLNGYNSIAQIDARSMNAKSDSKLELLLLG